VVKVNLERKKRRGPEPLDPRILRTHCISSRLNDLELIQLDRQRGRLGRGEYLRCAGLDVLPPMIMIPPINQLAWVQLSRAAGNLNVICKALNLNQSGDGVSVSHDEIAQALKEFRASLIGAKL
jgi:hypothetical protein